LALVGEEAGIELEKGLHGVLRRCVCIHLTIYRIDKKAQNIGLFNRLDR
jgi:hypothetical protein